MGVWPNHREDIIHLAISKYFPDFEGECIFEGRPQNVRSTIFSAAVIGCIDSKETIVNLGVNNEVLELLLLRNGTTLQNILIPLNNMIEDVPIRNLRVLTAESLAGVLIIKKVIIFFAMLTKNYNLNVVKKAQNNLKIIVSVTVFVMKLMLLKQFNLKRETVN